jgi:hypothetical protein
MLTAHHHQFELVAVFLNFLGGGFLAWDALSPVAKIYVEKGREKYEAYKAKRGKTTVKKTGKALDSTSRSQLLARLGFLAMTSGFLLDFLLKW